MAMEFAARVAWTEREWDASACRDNSRMKSELLDPLNLPLALALAPPVNPTVQ